MSSKAARELAAMRHKHEHTCPECGRLFVGLRQAITCSNACRQRRNRKRHVYEVQVITPDRETRVKYLNRTLAFRAYQAEVHATGPRTEICLHDLVAGKTLRTNITS